MDNPIERAYDIIRFLCELKLRYPENRMYWSDFEQSLMDGIRISTPRELSDSCNFVADVLADYLKGKQ